MLHNTFLGTKFGSDSQVTVIAKGEIVGDYIVKCSTCAKDAELFGEGVFKTRKERLVRGILPCGCSGRFNWTQDQYIVKMNRYCNGKNILFLGYAGDFCGLKTKINMLCSVDKNIWQTTIDSILYANNGCPKCNSGGHKLADHVMIDRFMKSGAFLYGTVFTRSSIPSKSGTMIMWDYICPLCSSDEYVLSGTCSGVFSGDSGSFQAGHASCRCTKKYRWSKEQREYKISAIIETEGLNYTYDGLSGDWEDANETCVNFTCADHGAFSKTMGSFINGGSRCPSCSKTGYNPSKIGYIYVIRVIGDGKEGFVGFGISNVVDKRLKEHKKKLYADGFMMDTVDIFTGEGYNIMYTEKALKAELPCFRQNVSGFKTEATKLNNYDIVIEYLEILFPRTDGSVL